MADTTSAQFYKFADVLTAISIFIALIGFLYTWAKDRRLRTREYADRVRSAAANALAKIDRVGTCVGGYRNGVLN
jgi:hypothetical protein